MKRTSLSLAALLVTATLAMAGNATMAAAQSSDGGSAPQAAKNGHGNKNGNNKGNGHKGGGGNGGSIQIDFVCSDQGVDRIDAALTRIENRADLTDDQKPLFQAYSDAAKAAQDAFLAACQAPSDAAPAESDAPATPNPADMLQLKADNLRAEATAIDSVIPSANAFFASLSADQLANLMPRPRGDNR
ncbi:MAG: hypothetical protein H6873_12160 [Hyphomicrobiaceae bacterium]|nr:hypothetical protein [Hyphomicrobiaceae bacterium]